MKKKVLALISLMLVCMLAFSACTIEYIDDEPTSMPTSAPTEIPTEAPTAKPTESPKTYTVGYPSDCSDEFFFDDFDVDGQIAEGATLRFKNNAFAVANDYFEFKTNLAQYYSTTEVCNFTDDVVQYEYQVKFKTEYPSAVDHPTVGPAYCPFFGVRVYDHTDAYRPMDADSGVWIGINKSNTAMISFGNTGKWSKGEVTVMLPETFDTEHTLTIVDANGVISYYMNTSDEDYMLICTIDLTGAKIIVKDATDKQIFEKDNNLIIEGYLQEGVFKVFNHFGITFMDFVSINVLED